MTNLKHDYAAVRCEISPWTMRKARLWKSLTTDLLY